MPRPDLLRTPDARFANLPDFPFEPRYLDLDDPDFGPLRMHYIDEGPRDAPLALMLHGEPTWSYLYRKMIPPVVAAGYRAVAPDMIGFGRSDKFATRAPYTYDRFVAWTAQFVRRLDLTRITLVGQDWGGPIGLRVLSEMPDRFAAVLAANTLLPTCEAPPNGVAPWPGAQIANWVELCRTATDLPIPEIIAAVCTKRPPAEALAGYDAPFPDASYKAATLAITGLVPIDPTKPGIAENRRAWHVLDRFEKPFLTAFSDGDPSTKPWEAVFRQRVPGAAAQPRIEIAHAGHFLQEEQGEALAAALVALLQRTHREPPARRPHPTS
jgi:haloalkane dehalogenase